MKKLYQFITHDDTNWKVVEEVDEMEGSDDDSNWEVEEGGATLDG